MYGILHTYYLLHLTNKGSLSFKEEVEFSNWHPLYILGISKVESPVYDS